MLMSISELRTRITRWWMMKIRESTGRKNRKKKDLVNVRTDVLEKEKEEQLSHIPYVQKKKKPQPHVSSNQWNRSVHTSLLSLIIMQKSHLPQAVLLSIRKPVRSRNASVQLADSTPPKTSKTLGVEEPAHAMIVWTSDGPPNANRVTDGPRATETLWRKQ